jgi:sterol desaturase/sphingolipid hydroxylase (fatty acid hydroxylase superfamily)
MKTIDAFADFFRSFHIESVLILVFAAALLMEWITCKLNGWQVHNKRDSRCNFLIGAISFAADLLFSVITFPLWLYLYDHFRIWTLPANAWAFLTLFILVDFTEYWFHRFSHEVNVLWSAHQVHHQSRFFNLTVGLRTSFFVPFFNLFFYLAFPVLGFDPKAMVLIVLLQGVYQLLIHTRLVGKLGWIEYLLVTPSAHRVHHGKNELYLDRNYGKCFIVWDRLFGTYQAETENVEFGLKTPIKTNNAWKLVVQPYQDMLNLARKANDTTTKIQVFFNEPDWAWELTQQQEEITIPAAGPCE